MLARRIEKRSMKKFLGNLLVVTFITYGFLFVIGTCGGVAAGIILFAHKYLGVAGAVVAALLLVVIVIYFKYNYEIKEWIRDNLPGNREGRGPRGAIRERRREQMRRELDKLSALPISSYIGNSKTSVYHKPNCFKARLINHDNEISFNSVEQATRLNFKPCRVCRP